ncbi:hypothetical protein Aeqsu_2919 [Aequorivita sublithincola DSM 14238]|uniref:Acetyltransferase (Isoleucine patch superfamily) n=1 Tax=Aequorivita sublithincola (strain DSM 14238 / LMG 21431 / ACAM 643 / 9-3) TaxID=746697 RepID=I3YZE2_AEQSU|nr:acyltransferase [Aequorivita sublithincola]AFL82360.1 hypothetical protein Aeqsu_2919 [Aequorivita sublithincola DSM 14238]
MISTLLNIYRNYKKKYYLNIILKKAKSYILPLKVNGVSYINENTYLGKNVNFNGMKIMGKGKVTIGDNFHSGMDCLIITDTHNFMGEKIPYDDTYIIKDVTVEDNVWLGHGVIILGGVTIGEGCIIQAGSVVVKSLPPCSIAGGHPAVVFKKRDEEHYYLLKDQKKFH